MDLSHAVNGVRAQHAQVGHVDPLRVPLLDERHAPQTVRVTGETHRYLLADGWGGLGLGWGWVGVQVRVRVQVSSKAWGVQAYVQVSLVDLVDDEKMSRQQLLEQKDGPALQRLRENRVVGVGAGLTGDVPRLDTYTRTFNTLLWGKRHPR